MRQKTAGELHCIKCVYHSMIEGYVCCDYILVTGHRRNSPDPLKCDKFVKGDNRARFLICDGIENVPHEKIKEYFSRLPGRVHKGGRPKLTDPCPGLKYIPPTEHGNYSKTMEVDIDAWTNLLTNGPLKSISAHTGIKYETLRYYNDRKRISDWAANLILEVYDIDVRKDS